MDALIAATHGTAECLGILDKTGTLEAGKRADLLVVHGNPIRDITMLSSRDSIFLVMKDGDIQLAGDFDPNKAGKTG